MDDRTEWIHLRGGREHNLQDVDIRIPRRRVTVITGVSGSGKSSLAFDTLFREGQRRFLETLPAFSRSLVGGLSRPAFASLEGLGPAVASGQRVSLTNPRSTVGTLTEVWDLLRLLFSRLGAAPDGTRLARGDFSFNGPGACPRCGGLGVEDALDPELLVKDSALTLREGALHVSTPNGYLMYSQVTLAVLDEVLKAHGGSVDIPWAELSPEARRVVLEGSTRLKVPYGKHPLENRLKWTGITARPRQEGFYRGLLPVMEEILRGKRNDSILRYVRTAPCPECGGSRLGPLPRAARWRGRTITDLAALTAEDLGAFLAGLEAGAEAPVLEPIRRDIAARTALLEELGLGYLAFDRPAPTLSPGEAQRLRLLGLALGDLRGLLLVLDEPSAGLHPADASRLLGVLRRLRDQGQTVVVVEHDGLIVRGADWVVDLGPGPGARGGRVLHAGPPEGLLGPGEATPTRTWLAGTPEPPREVRRGPALAFRSLRRNNLRDLDVDLVEGGLNVVTGVSGAGKTSLLDEVASRMEGGRLLKVDAAPIGRTPRSNPATYTGAFDLVRNLFAGTPEAKAQGLGKGHFTFNTPGGRCEACEGAGSLEVGMRHLGSVLVPCEACGGRRFHPEVLEVRWRGRSVADVLDMAVAEARTFFGDQPKLARILGALADCGLGHLALGQAATTLSGGEAQRVKLAAELARAGKGGSLIVLDEPTTGLHAADTRVLLDAWDRLLDAGHTILAADNDPAVIRRADRVLDLGPGSGPRGGALVVAGTPAQVEACAASRTGQALRGLDAPLPAAPPEGPEPPMRLEGAATHNLKGIDVLIPATGLTVVTGPSGSGKSSLVFDTLLAECRARFTDLVSPWARRLLPRGGGAVLAGARDLRAAVAVPQARGRRNPRSRVGTAADLDERLRMLFARCSGTGLPASAFSPNTDRGACPACRGLGLRQACDPERLVTHPHLPLGAGALGGTRFGAYLGEPDGRFIATLRAVGRELGLDFERPWRDLEPRARKVAMDGCGDRIFQVDWAYRRGAREGVHRLEAPWEGFKALVEAEYERVHADGKGESLEALLADLTCPACAGERLGPEAAAARVEGRRLPEVLALPVADLGAWLRGLPPGPAGPLVQGLLPRIGALVAAGLGHLAPDREMATLSGGEAQRLRLASALGAGLTGVCYVLDEPTRGLHPRDTARLLAVLRSLAETNAVLVVEHDPALVAAAGHLIRLGPGAGPGGGWIQEGPIPETAPVPGRAPRPGLPGVRVRGARLHNLKGVDAHFPAGCLVAVAGVSGSGKTSLVRGVLGASLEAFLAGRGPVGCEGLEVLAPLARVEGLDQMGAPPGSQATLASACGAAEPLRKAFAATPDAKARKLQARHFSTASPGGRCEACEGRGTVAVPMDLLPDVLVGCEACGGLGFRGPVLECRLEGRTIAEWLAGTVAEALAAAPSKALREPLAALAGVGLGYLRLGQGASSLSGGEWQRLRLASLLADGDPRPGAFLLDEPGRGLGAGDLAALADALDRLAAQGHLVVMVEHHLELLRRADHVLELGPGGGPEGGWLFGGAQAP
ncbi:MAG TPA: hypothetical protein VK188_14220 [Holophaga sp.]|nr:hypothetical protein [Holophaga sp.]